MEINHTNRRAVVTGGARGIGLEIATSLAASGADVAIIDVLDTVHDAAADIRSKTNAETKGYLADVTDDQKIEEVMDDIASELGNPQILVNNAAITTNVAPTKDMGIEKYERDLEINLTGAFICSKFCLEFMIEEEHGRIINISSAAGELGGFGQAGYASSKAGILGLTKTIALEHATDGVTCNAIIPGMIESPASEAIRDDMLDRIVATIPTGERGEPADIANAVNFLASDQAKYINGAELNIDAGQRLFTF